MALRIAYALVYTCWRTRPVMQPATTLKLLAPPTLLTCMCMASCAVACVSSRTVLGAWPLGVLPLQQTVPTSPLADAVTRLATTRHHAFPLRAYTSKQVWAHLAVHVALAVPLLSCVAVLAWRTQGRALLQVLGRKAD